MNIRMLFVLAWFLFGTSCREVPVVHVDATPPIFPDYTNVVIPVNIAPLNFMMRDSVTRMEVLLKGSRDSMRVRGANQVCFGLKKWRCFLARHVGEEVQIQVRATYRMVKKVYQPFVWRISPDTIDSFLSYRLIEPGYEVWNNIRLVERNLTTFEERVLADNRLSHHSCMNCHIYGNQSGALSMFHLRGKQGGTILNRNGELRKINIRSQGMISPAIYGNFHPSGRFAVFSTNKVIPELHTTGSKRLEVYDRASDLIVVDFDTNLMSTKPFLSDSSSFETFPVFSAEGKDIYFCSAPFKLVPDSIHQLRYHILRVAFDEHTAQLGDRVDTIWNADVHRASASLLKTSPDGKYLLFTVADYGTFPIWHQEADLRLLHLKTGKIDRLENVNAFRSDTYHSWSSNSRWFVFASKRDDGIYGKPYFAHVDTSGRVEKPFVLPQRRPEWYDITLKSYNIPELSATPAAFDAADVETLYHDVEAEPVEFLKF